MDYLIIAIVCFAGGGFAMFVGLDVKRRTIEQMRSQQESQSKINQEQLKEIHRESQRVSQDTANLVNARQEFEKRVVTYKELQDENALLKTDLRNIGTSLRKLQLDRDSQSTVQAEIKKKVDAIGTMYLKENVKWIGKSLNANNFSLCKERLTDVIERCRGIGFEITREEEATYVAELRSEYEKAVRAAFEREEQVRIRAQIREEQKLEREIQREQLRIERERTALQEALAKALALTADQHSEEIESLKARLAEAEEKQRAISQAQLTKAGFVYVISNIGSFGDGVYKIGMTRRLEPQDRIRELGDASVPFPFDIHMMISCQNAPALENALHRQLFKQQVNKTNPRKEFFRSDIETIAHIVRDNHGEVAYTADAEALQYRQSLAMPDEDQEFIDHVYDELEDEDDTVGEEASQPLISSEKESASL